jgi:hypothetical protein
MFIRIGYVKMLVMSFSREVMGVKGGPVPGMGEDMRGYNRTKYTDRHQQIKRCHRREEAHVQNQAPDTLCTVV